MWGTTSPGRWNSRTEHLRFGHCSLAARLELVTRTCLNPLPGGHLSRPPPDPLSEACGPQGDGMEAGAEMSDGMSWRIEPATLADLPALATLFDAYRVFYRQPSDPGKARDFLGERLERGESVIFLAHDGGGAALGFTQLYPCFSSVAARRLWVLNDLYVERWARR